MLEEVAYLAYHFHWSLEELFDMEHFDRQHWVREVDKINTRRNKEDEERIAEFMNQFR